MTRASWENLRAPDTAFLPSGRCQFCPRPAVDLLPYKGYIPMSKPTHSLQQIQALVRQLGARAFSKTALDGGQGELGMTTREMISMILARKDTACYKTMKSTKIPSAMQDVYQWPTPDGQMAYVKFCLHQQSDVVVSFKRL